MFRLKQDLSKFSFKVSKDLGISNFTIQLTPKNVIVDPASTSQETRGDSNYNVSDPSIIYTAGKLTVRNALSYSNFTSLNPNIATIDSEGEITRISEGIAGFSFTDKGVTKIFYVDLNNKANSDTVYEFVSLISGSLAEHCSNNVDSLLNGSQTMEANGNIFDTQNHAAPTYTRNSDCWASSLDLTCISPWNSNASNRKAGTLVTPRHIINSAHYEFPVGTVVRFITSDNQIVERTILSRKRHPEYNRLSHLPDLTIYTLDSDLPASITPCKVLPSNWQNYISEENLTDTRIPALCLDQQEKALIGEFFLYTLYESNASIQLQYPVDSNRNTFSETIISGDSGNPAFLIVNGELVFFTVWTLGGAGRGTLISHYISEINQMITDADTLAGVSTGYTLTEASFSSFPTY
jgi:hypothetical protein